MLSQPGFRFISLEEGCRLHSYRDSKGVWTIGWGDTEGVIQGQTITQSAADHMFMARLGGFNATVRQCCTFVMRQYEEDALTAMAYNIGEGGIHHADLVRYLNTTLRAHWNKVTITDLFEHWAHPPELLGRRLREAHLLLTGDYGHGP